MRRTRTADVFVHDGWCVVARIHEGAEQSLDDAAENLAATAQECSGTRRPLLVDISVAKPLVPEVRHFYTGEQLIASFTALALRVDASPFGYTFGNIYLRVARPGVPTRLFSESNKAFGWLQSFRQ